MSHSIIWRRLHLQTHLYILWHYYYSVCQKLWYTICAAEHQISKCWFNTRSVMMMRVDLYKHSRSEMNTAAQAHTALVSTQPPLCSLWWSSPHLHKVCVSLLHEEGRVGTECMWTKSSSSGERGAVDCTVTLESCTELTGVMYWDRKSTRLNSSHL